MTPLHRATRAARGIRPEIQLLRALAVAAVVVNHVFPQRLPGGYAGVDVFFVVSGFLIARHLVAELDAHGRIRFAEFWARRIRRLLPAAFTVLLAAFVLTMTLLPAPARSDSLAEIVASAFYAQNWALIVSSTDYFAAEQLPSVVQHYWSLSVEEQFYLIWPLLLAAVWTLSRGRPIRLLVAVLAVGAVSFAVGVLTADSPASYFSTATRAWEFCAGAALALLPWLRAGELPERFGVLRRVSGPLGVAGIATAFVIYGPETSFPGAAALLPVLGTVLVILGGTPEGRWSIGLLARRRLVLAAGDISYSLYLWHWPLIVVLPFVALPFGGIDPRWRLGAVAAAVLLALATTRWVEDPFRRPRPHHRARRAFLLPLAGGAAVVAVVLGTQTLVIAPRAEAAAARVEALRSSGCFGVEAVLTGCDDPFGRELILDPDAAAVDKTSACPVGTTPPPTGSVARCEFDRADNSRTLALVGDSHAGTVSAVVAAAAKRAGYALRLYQYPGCPAFGTDAIRFPNRLEGIAAKDAGSWRACADFAEAAQREILHADDIEAVIVTNDTRSYFDPADESNGGLTAASVGRSLDELEHTGKRVVVLRDVPGLAFGLSAPMCLALHGVASSDCAIARDAALPANDPMVVAASARSVPVVDLGDLFCDAQLCHPAVGGVVAYWDRAHLTATMVDSLAPALEARVGAALAARTP